MLIDKARSALLADVGQPDYGAAVMRVVSRDVNCDSSQISWHFSNSLVSRSADMLQGG